MLKLRSMAAVISAAAIASISFSAVAQDALEQIKKRGTLIVGVKADYKPYGFRDPSGKIIGIEPDLAQDVANKLGVKLELVPVVSSNRMQFLEQGKIELPALDVDFGEMLSAEAVRALSNGRRHVRALHHRALIQPKRAMLPHGLDNIERVRMEIGAIDRKRGSRQVGAFKLQLGREL